MMEPSMTKLKAHVDTEESLAIFGTKKEADLLQKIGKAKLTQMMEYMISTRVFDERGMMLQRQGRIGFYVPSFGQEAIQIGTAAPLLEKDWCFTTYREPGVFLWRGMSLKDMLCNLYGNASDLCQGRQMPVHYSDPKHRLFSISSPIATQLPQAVGVAMASQMQGKGEVVLAYMGDGGTSENDFHTGLTFAGVTKAPIVFICTNNQYAISVPIQKQCAARYLSDKARGYGMPGIRVDGNDILSVFEVTSKAVDRARQGGGPSFIECLTFRMGPHSSSDDPTRYRDSDLYDTWKKRDPIELFRSCLLKHSLWQESSDFEESFKAKLAQAISEVETIPAPDVKSLFEDVYSQKTSTLLKQEARLLEELKALQEIQNTSEAFPL